MSLSNPGNQPHIVKPKKPKKTDAVPCGIAYTCWCAHCDGFMVVELSDLRGIDQNEAKCNACGLMTKLALPAARIPTPPPPERKPQPTSNIRMISLGD